MKAIFSLFILFIFITISNAQFEIKGSVTDDSGRIVEFAQVYIHGTDYMSQTDENGYFSIKGIELGQYVLKVSFLGYLDYSKSIYIDKDLDLEIVLQQKTFELNEVHIDATRVSDKMPFAYKNINKKNIEKGNTGEDLPFLLKHTPSVVTTSDAGAGIGYTGIRIRGTDPTRINVTVNGIPLNDSESQQVYWVDLPDLAGSTESIQIQRGVGSSTNGAGAFGGTVSIHTDKIQENPFLSIEGSTGSYNTRKISAKAGTGLMNDKYSVDVRYSLIKSDGYIDRASSGLSSFFFSSTRLFKNSSLKFNAIVGHEKTYQAWYGLPVQFYRNDTIRTYNNAGTDYFKKEPAYDNQVDDYTQNHFQLFYDSKINDNTSLNLAAHYTRGSGFYEQYKVEEDLSEYGIERSDIQNPDIIRQKWLKNDFFGIVYNLKHKMDNSELIIGGAANKYTGDHFGVVDSIVNYSNYDRNHVYYKNTGLKSDINVYSKYIYTLFDKINLYGDLQYRYVDYEISGSDDNAGILNIQDKFHFFNPKIGLQYNFLKNIVGYASFSVANKEPNRKDYSENLTDISPKHETLYDTEVGLKYLGDKVFAAVNAYNMGYKNQLVHTGKLDDVGAHIRENVDKSYRRGIELEMATNIYHFFSINANATFSKNKINEYKEYISNWDAPYTPIEIDHKDTDISFSPNLVAGVGASIDLSNLVSLNKYGSLNYNIFHKYVGKQYLDNTMNNKASLDAYSYTNMGLSYSLSKGIFKNIEVTLKLNNVFNKKYVTNGWVARIKSEEYNPVPDDSYTEKEKDGIYHYMGLYPQALRNFMFRIKFEF